MTRLPKALKQRRAELAYEHVTLLQRLAEVDTEIRALDFSLRTLDPSWTPPTRTGKPCKATVLPRGAVSMGCLALLRQQPVLWTGEIAQALARQYSVTFADRRAELDFASAVAMALRRYERRGFVDAAERNPATGELRWRLKRGANGRLSVVSFGAPAAVAQE